MRKTLVIAWREYRAMVGTRAFLIGMAVMPLLMLGTLCVPAVLSGLQQPAVRRIAVIDQTGVLLQPLQQAAEQRNQQLSERQPELSQSGHHDMLAVLGMQDRHLYEFESLPADDFDDSDRLLLSERIRSGTLHAFLEIPGSVLRSAGPVAGTDGAAESLMWVSEDAALSDTRRWCEQLVDGLLLQHRLADSLPPALLPAVISQLSAPTGIGPVGLYYRDENGRIQRGTRQTSLTALALPIGVMAMMFMAILLSVQPMLESVLEEKTLRISEVLLGSVSATQLMTGKLVGNAAGAMTIFGLYASAAAVAVWMQGAADSIPWSLLPWLLMFQLLAVLLFSSVFMSVAACVSQMREAQCLLMPVWLVLTLPLLLWFTVIREPNGTLATVASFLPPATPLLMAVRMCSGAVIPLWQSVLSLLLLLAGTGFGIMTASRLYRAGILRQGQAPGFSELLLLAWRGEAGG
jgi:ABC-2 type transport system permease protein